MCVCVCLSICRARARVCVCVLGFDKLQKPGAFAAILSQVQRRFCDNIEVEDGIAMNGALEENLFVVIICVLNRIPIFMVGKVHDF